MDARFQKLDDEIISLSDAFGISEELSTRFILMVRRYGSNEVISVCRPCSTLYFESNFRFSNLLGKDIQYPVFFQQSPNLESVSEDV